MFQSAFRQFADGDLKSGSKLHNFKEKRIKQLDYYIIAESSR